MTKKAYINKNFAVYREKMNEPRHQLGKICFVLSG